MYNLIYAFTSFSKFKDMTCFIKHNLLVYRHSPLLSGDRGDKGTPGLAGLPASLSSILDNEMDPVESKLSKSFQKY